MEIAKIIQGTEIAVKNDFKPDFSHLRAIEREYIQNALSCQISAKESNLGVVLAETISYCSQYAGFNIHLNKHDLLGLVKITQAELLELYPSLGVLEVESAIKKGIRGEFGTYVGISAKNMVTWVGMYINEEDRKETIKRYKQMKEEQEKPKTPEEIDAIYEATYNDDLQLMKEGLVVYPSEPMFKWCEAKGIIKLTLEEKQSTMNEVISEYQSYLSGAMTLQDKEHYKAVLDNPNELAKICRKKEYFKHLKKVSQK
jgi:hypothetical protein